MAILTELQPKELFVDLGYCVAEVQDGTRGYHYKPKRDIIGRLRGDKSPPGGLLLLCCGGEKQSPAGGIRRHRPTGRAAPNRPFATTKRWCADRRSAQRKNPASTIPLIIDRQENERAQN